MKILALEFSAPTRSVAAWDSDLPGAHPGQPGCGLAIAVHGQDLGPTHLVSQALDQAGWHPEDVERLAVGLGPGSYTGIRVAIAYAQGWHLAFPVPVAGLATTLAIAHQVRRAGDTGLIQIVVDAQRNEFCLAQYHLSVSGVVEAAPMRLVPAATLAQHLEPSAQAFTPDSGIHVSGVTHLAPCALELCRLAAVVPPIPCPEHLTPIYLRPTQFTKAAPSTSPR